MGKLSFPKFEHKASGIRNTNEVFDKQTTIGQRTADKVAAVMGSWSFIITQSVIMVVWIMLNITAYVMHWDPYPFILMNLVLSMQAAYAAPMIMMSQNRQAARDRLEAHNDYLINLKAEEEVRAILEHLDAQNKALLEIHDVLLATHGLKHLGNIELKS
jgi:uncharacterized membrane protein